MSCDCRYHLMYVNRCEDQQPTTGQELDHVDDLTAQVTDWCE